MMMMMMAYQCAPRWWEKGRRVAIRADRTVVCMKGFPVPK